MNAGLLDREMRPMPGVREVWDGSVCHLVRDEHFVAAFDAGVPDAVALSSPRLGQVAEADASASEFDAKAQQPTRRKSGQVGRDPDDATATTTTPPAKRMPGTAQRQRARTRVPVPPPPPPP
jgi:hypothetical protein